MVEVTFGCKPHTKCWKSLEILPGRTRVDGWKHVENEEDIVWCVAFFLKHNAELSESRFTISSNMAVCEKLQYLDMYSHCTGSGLK